MSVLPGTRIVIATDMPAQGALAHLLFAILLTASLSAQAIDHTDGLAAFPLEQTVFDLRCNQRARTNPNVVFETLAVQVTSSKGAAVFCDATWRNETQHTLRGSIDRALDTNSIGVPNLGPSSTNPQMRETLEVEWEKIASQVLVFTAIQHGVRLIEEKTRRELAGSWVRDWFVSASSLFARPTWSDSGKFLTNYVFHPMGGSVYAHIYKQNDSLGRKLNSGLSREYFTHFARASVVSAVSSVQFEVGPLSEASIGNVGMPPNQNKMAWVDVVVTPTIGAVWMMGEDALDRYLIQRLERKIDSEVSRILIRILLNPTRSVANVLRSEKPWKRDGRS